MTFESERARALALETLDFVLFQVGKKKLFVRHKSNFQNGSPPEKLQLMPYSFGTDHQFSPFSPTLLAPLADGLIFFNGLLHSCGTPKA